jgi:plasmid stabilization system protein ParE
MATSTKRKAEKQYRVIWEIDVTAKSPRAAAKEARRIQQDCESIATFFIVRPMSGRIRKDSLVEL